MEEKPCRPSDYAHRRGSAGDAGMTHAWSSRLYWRERAVSSFDLCIGVSNDFANDFAKSFSSFLRIGAFGRSSKGVWAWPAPLARWRTRTCRTRSNYRCWIRYSSTSKLSISHFAERAGRVAGSFDPPAPSENLPAETAWCCTYQNCPQMSLSRLDRADRP